MRKTAQLLRLALAVATLAAPGAAIARDQCATGHSEVLVEGPQPLIDKLIEAVPQSAGVLFAKGHFDSARINYVGRLAASGVSWDLVHVTTIWGESCRATKRLLVFDAGGSYVGNYSGVDQPGEVAQGRIVFPTGEEVRFDGASPPEQLYVDGETHSLGRP